MELEAAKELVTQLTVAAEDEGFELGREVFDKEKFWEAVRTKDRLWQVVVDALVGGQTFDRREIASLLAGLRLLQDETCWNHDILDIASDGGEVKPLSNAEIDELCERINLCTVPC